MQALLQEELDWAYLFLTALRHGTLALLYRNLVAACPDAVPCDTLEDFRRHCEAAASRNHLLTAELLRLLRLLAAHGISAVPYKGPALAALVYGDVALRRFGDLDLLVRPRNAVRARELLLAAGYAGTQTHAQAAAQLRSRVAYNYELFRAEGQVAVELHWAVTSPDNAFPLDLDRVWRRLHSVSLEGERVLHFQPEDLLLILCQHGSKHKWKRLAWICDIAELLRAHPRLDWGAALKRARRLGCRRMLFLGLWLAEELLGASLPEEISRLVRTDRTALELGQHVRERLFRPVDELLALREGPQFRNRLRERLRDRLPFYLYSLPAYLARRLRPTAADRNLLPLPAPLSFLYYLIRPFRLLARLGLSRINPVFSQARLRCGTSPKE